MSNDPLRERAQSLFAAATSLGIAAACLARGLPLLCGARPGTPLRVFCVAAFDMLHRLRHVRPLPTNCVQSLSAFLDFGACANRALDGKAFHRSEFRQTRVFLRTRGHDRLVSEYLRRLNTIERARPRLQENEECFPQTREYREAVIRLSLGTAAVLAQVSPRIDEGIRATRNETGLNLLFRVAMLCQIIDDVFDVSEDLAAGLASFATSSTSLAQALSSTRTAAREYATVNVEPGAGAAFALRAALTLVSIVTQGVIAARRGWLRLQGDAGFVRGDSPAPEVLLSGPFQKFAEGHG